MSADDLGFDPDLGYRTSLHEENDHQYITIETTTMEMSPDRTHHPRRKHDSRPIRHRTSRRQPR